MKITIEKHELKRTIIRYLCIHSAGADVTYEDSVALADECVEELINKADHICR